MHLRQFNERCALIGMCRYIFAVRNTKQELDDVRNGEGDVLNRRVHAALLPFVRSLVLLEFFSSRVVVGSISAETNASMSKGCCERDARIRAAITASISDSSQPTDRGPSRIGGGSVPFLTYFHVVDVACPVFAFS